MGSSGAASMVLGPIEGAATGYIGAKSANNAAADQEAAANNATNAQLSMFNTEQNNLAPYRQAGETALTNLQGAMPDLTRQFNMSDFQNNPGYQFQLQQGQQAVQNSAAARGLLNSSAAMQGMDNYTQGLANQDYQQALNNFTANQQQRYNMLAGVASSGQGAINQINAAGQNAANNMSSNMIAAGNAAAAGQIATGNAIAGGLQTGMNGFMQGQYMNAMGGGGSNWSSPTVPYAAPAAGSQIMGGGDNLNADLMSA